MAKGPASAKEIEDPPEQWQFTKKMWLVLGVQTLLMTSQIHLELNMSLLLVAQKSPWTKEAAGYHHFHSKPDPQSFTQNYNQAKLITPNLLSTLGESLEIHPRGLCQPRRAWELHWQSSYQEVQGQKADFQRPVHVPWWETAKRVRGQRRRQSRLGSPEPRFRPRGTPTRVLGSRGLGPKVSSAASRALIRFGCQGPAVGPQGAARRAGAQVAALSRAQGERRGGAARHRSGLGPGRGQAAPPPPPAHREPAVQPRGRGVDRAFCGRGAAELKRPRCRTSEAPRRPGGRRRAASSRRKPASRAPPQSVPYLGAERRGDERAAEGQGASRRRRRAGPPARRLPTRPARRYLRRRVGAANRKLESARGAAAALSAGRKRARRSPGSGSSRAPPTSPPLPPAGPRERSPQCSDSPEPPPRPGRFSRKRLQLILKEDNAKSNLPLHW
ncbi:basic salivary proline-rich protein 1-like [Herpailurus yagouaroundi]|uniref:basic salivary proline-rich protein 1-like n=1 Tax=Herpailurus yagouaroundi TaxID=1608482 RepID=UPI001AD72555|nr:basic salivary proline-rich protein 1-like [Puma yagouaroundi]